MKDELNKGHMSEFIALSPKVYAYQQFRLIKHLQNIKNYKYFLNIMYNNKTCQIILKAI